MGKKYDGRYASGEEIQEGDIVRIGERVMDPAKPGDVYTVLPPGSSHVPSSIRYSDREDGITWRPAPLFTLIARTGEPVKFQPGDVVEFTEDPYAPLTDKKAGDRDTVEALDDDGDPILACDTIKHCGWGHTAPFRLVHRPGAAEALPPVGLPLTPETAKLLQPGDLVRCDNDAGDPNLFGHTGTIYPITREGVVQAAFGEVPNIPRSPQRFTFIGRPDADGWVPWEGGENPLGDTVVETRHRSGREYVGGDAEAASRWLQGPGFWIHDGSFSDIVAFRLPRADQKTETAEKPVASIADVARDLRPGQRVRVTLEGVVEINGKVRGGEGQALWGAMSGALAEASSLEVIAEAPLAVGDRVVTPDEEEGVIRFIDDDGHALVRMDSGPATVFATCALTPEKS